MARTMNTIGPMLRRSIHKMKKRKVSKFVYWAPRILSIAFLLFLAMFSLDVFGNGYGFWETVVGLLMHNIPVFVLAALLWISWKHEMVGAWTFFIAGILYIILTLVRTQFEWYLLSWVLTISGPAFVIGYLFLLNWKKKRK
jgi:hypothetical protein